MENNSRKSLTALMSQKLLQRLKQNILNSMKNVFFSLAFMLIGSFAFANNYENIKSKEVSGLINKSTSFKFYSTDKNNNYVEYEYSALTDSCTITTVTQVISNGEVTYTHTTLWHMDGISCENLALICRAVSII
jgi:hypothetical protein